MHWLLVLLTGLSCSALAADALHCIVHETSAVNHLYKKCGPEEVCFTVLRKLSFLDVVVSSRGCAKTYPASFKMDYCYPDETSTLFTCYCNIADNCNRVHGMYDFIENVVIHSKCNCTNGVHSSLVPTDSVFSVMLLILLDAIIALYQLPFACPL